MSSGTNDRDPTGSDEGLDHDDPVVQKIVEQMGALDEQERAIRTESENSLRDWIVETFQVSLARAQQLVRVVQQALINLGLS